MFVTGENCSTKSVTTKVDKLLKALSS